jgi:hypothetical protein
MKEFVKAFFQIILCLAMSGCALAFGPELSVTITATHLGSVLMQNNGVGEDWQTPSYSLNGERVPPAGSVTVGMTTWDELELNTRYEEYDDVYVDIGTGSYSIRVITALRERGDTFEIIIDTKVPEWKSDSPGTGTTFALWRDTFAITIQ